METLRAEIVTLILSIGASLALGKSASREVVKRLVEAHPEIAPKFQASVLVAAVEGEVSDDKVPDSEIVQIQSDLRKQIDDSIEAESRRHTPLVGSRR